MERAGRLVCPWRWLAGALLAGVSQLACALDFRSVGAEPAILYDAPAQRGQKLFVAPRGMPLEVVVGQGDWLRVRDASGALAWIEKRAVTDKRMLVSTAVATVRAAPDGNAAPQFQVARGVLLEFVEAAPGGWLRVRHADGSAGFVSAAEVWGE